MTLASILGLLTAAYILTIRPWEECSSCGWLTKDENGRCAGCGGKRW